MIDISDDLSQNLNSEVQNIKPSVKAWMADLRYLENVNAITTSHRLDKQILDRNPLLYFRMDKTNYSASSSSPVNRIKNEGSAKLDFGVGQSGTSGGNFVITSNDSSTPDYFHFGNSYYERSEPRRIEDKFLASTSDNLLSYMCKSTSPEDYDGRYYSWDTGGLSWSVSSNVAVFSDYRATNISYRPILLQDVQGIDHYVDFKFNTSIPDKACAVIRYVDVNNFIYVVDNTTLTTGSIKIFQRKAGVDTELASINSTHFSTSKYYRFVADYNTFTLYDLGTSEPTESTSGSSVITAYTDDEYFQSAQCTKTGAGCLYTAATAQTVRINYLAVGGWNYLSHCCDFDNVFYFFADSTLISTNKSAEFEKLYKDGDFSYYFLLSPSASGPVNQTILWLGAENRETGFRISYNTSTQKLTAKIINVYEVATDLASASSLTSGSQYHIAVIKSGDSLKIYVNGALDSSTTLTTNYEILDVVAKGSPCIIIGADIVGAAFGESNDIHAFNGNMADFAAFAAALSAEDVAAMYYSFSWAADTPKDSTDLYFTAERVFEAGIEETYAYPITNGYSSNILQSNFSYNSYVVDSNFDVKSNYYWMTRQKSDSSGIMANDDYIKLTFDSHPCNKIIVSTGHDLGGVDDFDIEYGNSSGSLGSGTYTFENQSIKIINLADKYDLTYIKITVKTTNSGNDFGRIYGINPIWEVDLSDYVISFDVSKVRDNFDASLPIGATAANSGSITLDNTEQLFSPYGDSIYKNYVYPDTIFFISTNHYLEDGNEEVIISEYMYADTWSFSNSSMTTTVDFRDYSKYLQEETLLSYYSQFINAGKACKEIILSAGFPARKVKYFDTYRNTIAQDNPSVFIPFNETKSDLTSLASIYSGGDNYAGVYDMCSGAFILGHSSTGYATGSSLIKSEYFTYQNDEIRSDDGLSIKSYSPEVKYGSYKIGSSDCVFFANKSYPKSTPENWIFLNESNWSIEFASMPDQDDALNYDYYLPIFYSKNSAGTDTEFKISHKPQADNKVSYEVYIKTTTTSYTIESDQYIRNISHLITLTKNSSGVYALFIDGKADGVAATAGTLSSDYLFRLAANSNSYISYFSKFDYVLDSDQISKHYISSVIPLYNNFQYLYAFDQTYWDAMLEIATADIGMFYINEYGEFVYEHRTALNDKLFSRYQSSQYNLSDNLNIISGNLRTDVQTNKVIVKVSNLYIDANSLNSLWSAEDGESLAVTTITSQISPLSQDILLENAENPLWLPEGYLKIDDEIIKYELLVDNKISNLTRGMFGTNVTWHSANAKAREVRVYDIEYASKPAVDVRYPFISGNKFYNEVDIDYFEAGASKARVIVSANSSLASGSLAILQGTNALTNISYNFSIAGLILEERQQKETFEDQSSEIKSNIRRYRIKELVVENKFIQNKIYAKILSSYILSYFSAPVPILNVSITGVPHLQLGDLITITQFDDLGIENAKYWIIENNINYDGGLTQNLVLRRYADPVIPDQFVVNSDTISLGFASENSLDLSTNYYEYL